MPPVKKLPYSCPSCESQLNVKSLQCSKCGTEVVGSFELPIFARLTVDELKFATSFIKNSGSLKIMAEEMGLSYPTIRAVLDKLIEKFIESEK